MAKNVNHVSHIKSKQIVDGKPKLPEASSLIEGEIAINFAEGVETISTKNESGNVVTFSSDDYYTSKKLGSGFTGENSGRTVTDVIIENEEIVSNALTDLDERIDTLSGTVSAHTENTDIHVTAADKTAWNTKLDASAIVNFFDDAKYEDSGTTKVINFYHGSTIKATIDASDFIVDGMVDDVRVENGNLVIDFNTESGKQDISIPLTDIFDPSNYYNKTAIDSLVGSGFTSSSITEVIIENEEITSAALTDLDERKLDATAYTPTDLSNYYTKSETSGKTEIQNALDAKANTATTLAGYGITDAYTKSETSGKTEIQNALDAKTDTATTTALNNVVTAHTGNTDIHVTTGDKSTWNAVTAKTDNSAFTAHTGNTDIHVTTGDKTTWNAVTAKTDNSAFTAHTANTTVHVTAAERTSWNTAVSGVTDLSGQSETIAAALNEVNIKADNLIPVTYADLVNLKASNELKPGTLYRITDYQCTTSQANTQSAGHQFDVIVRADSVNVLNENAYAALHSGDTYFANSKLEAWELKYCIDNDTTRFAWADSTNGKGVIYRMVDEFDNDVPYDFKNIQYVIKMGFTAYGQYGSSYTTTYERYEANDTTVSGTLYYGFKRVSYTPGPPPMGEYVWTTPVLTTSMSLYNISEGSVSSVTGTITKVATSSFTTFTFDQNGSEASISGSSKSVTENSIASYVTSNKQTLNVIYFRSTGSTLSAYGNSFKANCHDMSFSYNCYGNTFGTNNYNNSFGNSCSSNSFGNSYYGNSFGNSCSSNSFGNGCYRNSFGNYNNNNSFGNHCQYISFLKDYTYYIIVEDGNEYIDVTSTQTTNSYNVLRNFTIAQGVNNTSTTKTISHNTVNDTFQTVYQPANSQVISV